MVNACCGICHNDIDLNDIILEGLMDKQLVPMSPDPSNVVMDIAKHIKDTCSIDKLEPDDNSFNVSMDEELYEKYLPPNLSMETVEAVKQYEANLRLGVMIGISEAVLPSLKRDIGIDTVIAHTYLPHDQLLRTVIDVVSNEISNSINVTQEVIAGNDFDIERMECITKAISDKFFHELTD